MKQTPKVKCAKCKIIINFPLLFTFLITVEEPEEILGILTIPAEVEILETFLFDPLQKCVYQKLICKNCKLTKNIETILGRTFHSVQKIKTQFIKKIAIFSKQINIKFKIYSSTSLAVCNHCNKFFGIGARHQNLPFSFQSIIKFFHKNLLVANDSLNNPTNILNVHREIYCARCFRNGTRVKLGICHVAVKKYSKLKLERFIVNNETVSAIDLIILDQNFCDKLFAREQNTRVIPLTTRFNEDRRLMLRVWKIEIKTRFKNDYGKLLAILKNMKQMIDRLCLSLEDLENQILDMMIRVERFIDQFYGFKSLSYPQLF